MLPQTIEELLTVDSFGGKERQLKKKRMVQHPGIYGHHKLELVGYCNQIRIGRLLGHKIGKE